MKRSVLNNPAVTKVYYLLKPAIPRSMQIMLRRMVVKRVLPKFASVWPIDESAGKPPEGWKEWPQGKQFALVLTHDVEGPKGVERVRRLADLERDLGFCSSFNFVVSKYETPDELRRYLESNGFEVGVHGCYHDSKTFASREIFLERAKIINHYLGKWGAEGFRAPSMLHNMEWIGELDVQYDLSTFDTDPFEPQAGGTGKIFPYLVPRASGGSPFVEMPYTLPQDFTVFILLGERTTDIWEKKLDWIAGKGGMALVNIHPDYMNFGSKPGAVDEYPAELYSRFLARVKRKYEGRFWNALPKDVSRFVKSGTHEDLGKEKPGALNDHPTTGLDGTNHR